MLFFQSIRFVVLLLMSIKFVYCEEPVEQTVNKPSVIIHLEIDGVIGPATVDYFERNLQKAIDSQAMAVLISLDTPGGLDTSMRRIIKKIISSPVPIISYVSPGGARAASAGTYILYASHIAAMAPATNLGAATPVQIGEFGDFGDNKNEQSKEETNTLIDPMSHKMVNDAAAYIRGLAKMHGRNEEWAEQAVRKAASLSAAEALDLNVIDLVAADIPDLLRQLQGRKLRITTQELVFNFTSPDIQTIKPDWRSKFLAVITNPSIAYILLMIGMYGLILEFYNPGGIVPGTVGGICLLLALYALQLLPVNYAGMGLILLGIALMTAEAFIPNFGILGLGGIVSFVIGSIILMDTDLPGFGIDLGVIAGFALSSAAFFIFVIGLLLKSRHSPIVSGKEQMQQSVGVALENFTGSGMVRIHGECWQAFCEQPLIKNEKVKVTAIDGLLLQVMPINNQEDSSCF